MDYLELCQEVARESGTVPNIGDPQTVSGQTGRLQRIVYWVNTAWQMIQHNELNWRWMNANFVGETVANVRNYQPDAIGISQRFGHWIWRGEERDNLFSSYKTSEGQGSEGLLSYVEWEKFRRIALVGGSEDATGAPVYVTVNDNNTLVFHPIPDGAYTIRGRYHKSPQALSADGDTPECPEQFHRAIVYRALMLLAQHDEAPEQFQAALFEYNIIMERLRQHQLPRFTIAGALA